MIKCAVFGYKDGGMELKRLVEEYMSGQRSLKVVLPQIGSLIKATDRSNDNTLQFLALMRQSKKIFRDSNDALLETRYNDLTQGIVAYLTGSSKSQLTWKEVIFSPHSKTKLAISDVSIVSRFHLDSPSTDAEFKKFDSVEQHLSSGIGITSADSRPDMTEQLKLCLDADYNIGHTGTTVDGIGVYQDMSRNKAIMKASKLTAKYVSLIAERYTDPTILFQSVPFIFSQVNHLIRNHFSGNILESACCVLSKIFPKDNATYQVVTGSVGDCMAFAWDPNSKEVVMLASARQYDFGAHYNPLSIADKLADSLIQRSMIDLPQEAVIFRMTDGAWQMLPNIQSEVHLDQSTHRSYIDTIIDVAKLSEIFSDFDESHPNPTVSDYRDMLLTEILRAVNTTKVSIREMIDEIQTQYIPECLKSFDIEPCTLKFGDFLKWLLNEDKNRHDEFVLMLNRLEYANSLMAEAQVVEIFTALNKGIDFGDDVLLTVQGVGNDYESYHKEEDGLKCNIL